MQGMTATTFDGKGSVTRTQAATFLVNMYKAFGYRGIKQVGGAAVGYENILPPLICMLHVSYLLVPCPNL
jgi:hypothetical protein